MKDGVGEAALEVIGLFVRGLPASLGWLLPASCVAGDDTAAS